MKLINSDIYQQINNSHCINRLAVFFLIFVFSEAAAQPFSQSQGKTEPGRDLLKDNNSSNIEYFKKTSLENEKSTVGQESTDNLSHLFLRDSQVQLRPREIRIAVGINYRTDQNERSFRNNRNRSLIIPLSISYGLTPTLEMNATFPYIYNEIEIISTDNVSKYSKDGLGDISIGLLYNIKPESITSPTITTSINIFTPTGEVANPTDLNGLSIGSGFWGVSFGLHFSKSVDPSVLFVNFGYQYNFDDDQYGSNIKPGAVFDYGFGAGFSVNSSVAFSGRLSGRYQKETELDSKLVRGSSSEPISFIGSMSFRISEKVRLETTFILGVSNDADDVSMGFTYIWNL